LGEDGAKHSGDHVVVGLGHQCQQVADEVHPAPLVPHHLERAPQSRDEAGVLAGDNQPHPGQPRFFRPVRKARQKAPLH
jgi:hypothetical protein